MLTPKQILHGGSFILPEDATLTGVLYQVTDDTASGSLALNGVLIVGHDGVSAATGATNGIAFIPLKITLKTGMKLSCGNASATLYFS